MKKLVSVILFFVMLFSLFGQPVSAEDPTEISVENDPSFSTKAFYPGDADCDGITTIIDATCIQKKLSEYQVKTFFAAAADIDNSGTISILDATYIQRFLVGLNDLDITEFNQVNDAAAAFIKEVNYDPADYSYSALASYVKDTTYKKDHPLGVEIEIPEKGTITFYGVSGTHSYAVNAGKETFYNLCPDAVTKYQFSSENGTFLKAGYLRPVGDLRMIKTKASINIRDLGGWNCDGGKVRYGLLFRGGEIDTSDIGIFRNVLGIRAELNLRWDHEVTSDISLLGEDVEFKHISGPWYTLKENESWLPDANEQILEYVMDKAIEGVPLYFHCSAGADRTGTAAFFIEALLGMSQSDIDKEYELTSFHTGIDTDANARRRDESIWKSFVKQFNGYEGSTITNKVVNWALSKGVTLDKINAFRKAMIDGEPSALTEESIKL